jgi:hypothetical protein
MAQWPCGVIVGTPALCPSYLGFESTADRCLLSIWYCVQETAG